MNLESNQTIPEGRIEHCMTSIREFLIIYGGYKELWDYQHYGLWILNTINGVWNQHLPPTEIKNTPLSSSIFAVGNLVYFIGGACRLYGYQATNSLVSFDITTTKWKTVCPHSNDNDPNRPPPSFRNLLVYHSGSLYVLRKTQENEDMDTMYKFCLGTSTWSLVPQNGMKPIFNRQMFGTVYKNQLYTFEDTYRAIYRFKEVRIFDFSIHTWTKRVTNSKTQQYPDNRIVESFAFSGSFGYMSGGKILYSDQYYSDIWRIDFETLEWIKLPYILKTGLTSHTMSVVDEIYLYSFGGCDIGSNYFNSLQRFILRPPSLYRLCLESIGKSQNLNSYIKSLPPSIVDELNIND
ncbi:Kelch domain-containing protein 10 [Thelohanellus kitauei]|uniref:Kelch domain-containing protein 10 n=1 Tax=Thelohanellus kitauei TaxID=669202 RepID=A0A0C2N4H7_THEKT|nr:Kelch domain-containing protein 10 [Thelohanellus kitauei]